MASGEGTHSEMVWPSAGVPMSWTSTGTDTVLSLSTTRVIWLGFLLTTLISVSPLDRS